MSDSDHRHFRFERRCRRYCSVAKSHIYVYEQGGAATIAGIHPRVVRNQQDGTLDIDEVLDAIRPSDDHFPVTRLVCIENTHNKCGGRVLPKEFIDRLGEAAHARGLLVHMDGARVMNACAALGTSPHELCAACDSVSVCLSKALGSPVGSVLVGPKDFIIRARRNRKALGGGMRQAGVIAAMGLYGIRTFSGESLVRDHGRLKKLASALATISGFKVDLDAVQSNILYFDTGEMAQVIVDLLKRSGILVIATGMHTIRACVHHQVSDEMINRAIDVFRGIPDALFAMDSVEGQQHR